MPMIEMNNSYDHLKRKLLTSVNSKILAIHIPGTGGNAQDNFPTRLALAKLNKKMQEQHQIAGIPFIELPGVGSGEKAPIFSRTDTLNFANREAPSIWDALKVNAQSSSNSEAEKFNEAFNHTLSLTDAGAHAAGFINGAGEEQNNELILNTLETLESDNALPEEIVLTGHSRGAINAIYLANEIYAKYGDKIKIHMVLTDPVPGPFHEMEWKKRVIPPNVKTFTAFYAQNHGNILFAPHDLSRLTFASPDTVITSYSTIDDHITITGNKKVTKACFDVFAGIFNQEFNSDVLGLDKIEKSLYEQSLEQGKDAVVKNVGQQYRKNALNELQSLDYYQELSKEEQKGKEDEINENAEKYEEFVKRAIENYPARFTGDMHSKDVFARRNCQYVAKTSIDVTFEDSNCLNDNLKKNLQKVRSDFDENPDELRLPPHQVSSNPVKEFVESTFDLEDEEEPSFKDQVKQNAELQRQRLSALNAVYREGNYYNVSSNEFLAYALLIPTLGFSATFFMTMQSYDHKLSVFILGLCTLNIATALYMMADTTYKIVHNIVKGGFFRPGFTPEQKMEQQSENSNKPVIIEDEQAKNEESDIQALTV